MKVLPYWPRMMKRATAAAYCDLSAAEFEREVIAGVLPRPIRLGNSEHWSRPAIDESLERLTGGSIPDWRKDSPLYNQAAAPLQKASVLGRPPKRRISKAAEPDIAEAYEQALSMRPRVKPKN